MTPPKGTAGVRAMARIRAVSSSGASIALNPPPIRQHLITSTFAAAQAFASAPGNDEPVDSRGTAYKDGSAQVSGTYTCAARG